jgi:hypothetical protein
MVLELVLVIKVKMFQSLQLKFFLLMLCSCQIVFGQENPKAKDSALIYRKIEKYSNKTKFKKFVHKLIFKSVANQQIASKSIRKIKKKSYRNSEGKVIRSINITTLDPFGYSDIDTTLQPNTFLHRSANAAHLKTKNIAIRNLLLMRKFDKLDSLLVKESERIIRSQKFIRSVTISSQSVSQDSTDVFVRVIDSWSLLPDFSTSLSVSEFSLKERNFFGLGHEFSNDYAKSLKDNNSGFSTSYTVPNIANTFVRAQVAYQEDLNRGYTKSVGLERPFYSIYARWAGGVFLDQNSNNLVVLDSLLNQKTESHTYNSQDYWAGSSFQIFKGNSDFNRGTNFISTARYFNKSYVRRSNAERDSLGIYSDEKLFLISIGISSRKYVQDKDVFNFNVIEDVATGFVYSLTSGYQNKNGVYQFYGGAKIGMGNYLSFGYLSGVLEYGTFYKFGKSRQSATNLELIYFTNLIELGKWKFRQFIKPQLVIGSDRLNNPTDQLNLNEENGLQGFNSRLFYGNKKLLLGFQLQGYSPWQVIGFRMNPYLSYSMGMLAEQGYGFKNSKLYSQLGIGVIISNDYLVFNSFQFSFSYYPTIPTDIGSNFKTNAIRTGDFGLQNFEISKPVLVNYQ